MISPHQASAIQALLWALASSWLLVSYSLIVPSILPCPPRQPGPGQRVNLPGRNWERSRWKLGTTKLWHIYILYRIILYYNIYIQTHTYILYIYLYRHRTHRIQCSYIMHVYACILSNHDETLFQHLSNTLWLDMFKFRLSFSNP